MDLDKRKKLILENIIRTYLETGEPVGSRTLSKDASLDVSPATIRNEMADLEEMGYIIQPHTSAGRVPTDLGYRFYVDELMQEKEREVNGLLNLFNQRMDRVENVLKNMAKMLARDTEYTTMISGPKYTENELKFIQLSRLDPSHLIAVVVMEGNSVRHKMIPVEGLTVTERDLLRLNVLLNSALQGKSLDDLTISFIRGLASQAGEHGSVIFEVLNAVSEAIEESSFEQPEIYTSGATNIFKYPELSDGDMAKEILSSLEDKDDLADFLSGAQADDHAIKVYIGDETPLRGMKNCSVVTVNYELGKGLRGTIGIMGPKRMDYERVIGTLKTLIGQLNDAYRKNEDD